MLDAKKLSCPQCKGKLRIRRKNVEVLGRLSYDDRKGNARRKFITHRRRYLYCDPCKQGFRIQKVDVKQW